MYHVVAVADPPDSNGNLGTIRNGSEIVILHAETSVLRSGTPHSIVEDLTPKDVGRPLAEPSERFRRWENVRACEECLGSLGVL